MVLSTAGQVVQSKGIVFAELTVADGAPAYKILLGARHCHPLLAKDARNGAPGVAQYSSTSAR